jgi:hypothetical protein
MNFEFSFLRCGLKLCLQAGRMIGALTPGGLWLPVLLVTFSVHASTYYIATNGNDSWDGTVASYVSGTTGPWATFANVPGAASPGTTFYIEGGIWSHTNDSTATMFNFYGANGKQAAPIVVTNYPGQTPIIYGSGPNNYGLQLKYSSWIKIFGLVITNAWRCVDISTSTNCEVANCVFTGGNTNYGYTLGPFTMDSSSQHNWIHNNLVYNALAAPVGDSTHCFSIGQFYSTTDFTSYNIIESNVVYWAGHDAMSIYGPTNLVRCNWIHNEPWYYRQDYGQVCGHRCLEVGGAMGVGSVIENNRLSHAGITGNGGAHGIEADGPGSTIIRNNFMINDDYGGICIYGGKVGSPIVPFWGSNYVYNNTIAYTGWAQECVTNYDANGVVVSVTDNYNWKMPLGLAWTTNNIFVNNLFWDNFGGASGTTIVSQPAAPQGIGIWVNNFTNINPQFVNTNDGGAFSQTAPNCSLQAGSPAIDAGTWLTTITSSSGSGTVTDAGYFFAGMTAAGHTVPGDTIQLQGQTSTATITAISGNTITINSSLTWTNGQGVALPYSGSAPDVGAYEYTSHPAPPIGLQIINAVPQG